MNTKTRILLGIGLIIFSIGMGYLLFQVFFARSPITGDRTTPPATREPSTSTFPFGSEADRTATDSTFVPGTLPTTGGISQGTANIIDTSVPVAPIVRTIFQGNAQNATLGANGNVQFYNGNDGKFYRIGTNGQPELLSDELFFSVRDVTWDNRGDKAIIEYPDGSNIIYNFSTKQAVTLPRHWEDFSFSNDGQQIVAKSMPLSPENRWLVSTDANGNNVKLIEPLGENANKVIVDWSANSQVIAFSRTGRALGLDREQILLVGQNGENFKSLTVEGRDFRPVWTPDGKRVLYSVYSERSGFRPELWIVDASGDMIGERRTFLNINTWADKCDFGATNSRYVYCGVPETLQEGAGFVPNIADLTGDTIYKIDTQTGARTAITTVQDGFFTVGNIKVNEQNNTMYVTDKQTNTLLEIKL
jgi:Tol biopolymer transport system component